MGCCTSSPSKKPTPETTSNQGNTHQNVYVPSPTASPGIVNSGGSGGPGGSSRPNSVSGPAAAQRDPLGSSRKQQPRLPSINIQAVIREGKKVVCGLYDYKPMSSDGSDGDLAFKKGDHLVVIKEDGDWWYAEHASTRQRGYIPVTYIAEVNSFKQFEWFHDKIARKDAEKLLSSEGNQKGTFLIRESESEHGSFSLSVLDFDSRTKERTVKHYRIRWLDDGVGCYIIARKKGSSVPDLVQQYSVDADGLCSALLYPCPRVKPEMYDMSHATRDKWEISRETLRFENKLGEGNFGEVWKGMWNKIIPVAIKTLKPGTMEPSKFLGEAAIMKRLHHRKLVALYAVCSKEEPIYIVTELMVGGSLLVCLRADRGQTILWNHIVDIAAQVSEGMFYLEKLGFIHRDLAARNVLLSDGNTVKIGDFGLAMDYNLQEEEQCKEGAKEKFPIKWTAPEAVRQKKFSIKSDVWAYGIFLLELVTYGETPYPNMTNRQALEFVERGKRHPKPADCQEEMYEIMLMCWKKSPDDRPTFEYLYHTMDDFNVSVASSYAAT